MMTPANTTPPVTISTLEEKIHALTQALKQEKTRIMHSKDAGLTTKYTETNTALKEALKHYEEIAGHPYEPPRPQVSQYRGRTFSGEHAARSDSDDTKPSASSSTPPLGK
jgi:hypothetical protein